MQDQSADRSIRGDRRKNDRGRATGARAIDRGDHRTWSGGRRPRRGEVLTPDVGPPRPSGDPSGREGRIHLIQPFRCERRCRIVAHTSGGRTTSGRSVRGSTAARRTPPPAPRRDGETTGAGRRRYRGGPVQCRSARRCRRPVRPVPCKRANRRADRHIRPPPAATAGSHVRLPACNAAKPPPLRFPIPGRAATANAAPRRDGGRRATRPHPCRRRATRAARPARSGTAAGP